MHPPRKASEGVFLRFMMLGQGGHWLAMRPSVCPWPLMGTHEEGGLLGRGGGAFRYWREAMPLGRAVPTPSSAGYPREGKNVACGSCLKYASAEDDACGGGSGGRRVGKRKHRRGHC